MAEYPGGIEELQQFLEDVDNKLPPGTLSNKFRLIVARMLQKAVVNGAKEVTAIQEKLEACEKANTQLESDKIVLLEKVEKLTDRCNALQKTDDALERREFATRVYYVLPRVLAKIVPEVDWEHFGVKRIVGVAVNAMKLHQGVSKESELNVVIKFPIEIAEQEIQGLATKGMSEKDLDKFGPLLVALLDKDSQLTFEMMLACRNHLESMRDQGHRAAHHQRPNPGALMDKIKKEVVDSGILGEEDILDGVMKYLAEYSVKFPHNTPIDMTKCRTKSAKKTMSSSKQKQDADSVGDDASFEGSDYPLFLDRALPSGRGPKHQDLKTNEFASPSTCTKGSSSQAYSSTGNVKRHLYSNNRNRRGQYNGGGIEHTYNVIDVTASARTPARKRDNDQSSGGMSSSSKKRKRHHSRHKHASGGSSNKRPKK